MTHGIPEYLPTMPDAIQFSMEQSEHFIDFSSPLPATTHTVEVTLQGKISSSKDFWKYTFMYTRRNTGYNS